MTITVLDSNKKHNFNQTMTSAKELLCCNCCLFPCCKFAEFHVVISCRLRLLMANNTKQTQIPILKTATAAVTGIKNNNIKYEDKTNASVLSHHHKANQGYQTPLHIQV